MEQRKKQILLERLTEYNKTVNNMSKFKLNTKEENLFCDIMQQFAEEYHTEQLRQSNIVGRSEQCNHVYQRVERGGEFQGNQCECGELEDLT